MNLNELIRNQEGVQDNSDLIDESEESILEGNVIQLVSFMLEEIEYGVDILSVHEILRIPDITRLPHTPDYIIGVINLRGNVIPVINMRNRFGFDNADFTELSRIIVIETGGKQVGLLVDNVYQVVRIPEVNIDPPADLIEGVSEDYLLGIGRLSDRLIIILNLENILFSEEEETETVQ